ncbi:conserved hypothetical protein [Pseudomonas sp. 8BK]|uniref:hypothetical protein n=1 Tax=Pseudomonas sp. 8BK TaxID=2653164 RepID=UPI0012F2C96E|nr:hypothetical protein [Pseudomonas sp. 8BK]VXC45634.1 conserved hypothetical protein [Pseudomonas sp. 8BK]
MSSLYPAVDVATAASYLDKTVLMEMYWEDEPETVWYCVHIVGVVLPIEGYCNQAYFMVVNFANARPSPDEMYFADIRTIRVIRHRDRHGSGNVLGRIAHPNQAGSRAALPARRNSSTVPANGSTGAAHP